MNSQEDKKVFNRKNIETNTNIRLVDTTRDENDTSSSSTRKELDMFCTNNPDIEDTISRECRGVIFHGDELILKGYPYAREYTVSQLDITNEKFKSLIEKGEYTCFEAHEGTLIRAFYFNDKWWYSTHRRLDAYKSKWSTNESFGTIFENSLRNELLGAGLNDTLVEENPISVLEQNMNKEEQYMFFVRNTESNRIVCDPPEKPTVYHVGTYVKGKLIFDRDINLRSPVQYRFSSVCDLVNTINDLDYHKVQGIIIFFKDSVEKIYIDMYKRLFDIRGNEPSLKYRYLQLRTEMESSYLLHNLYPSWSPVFDEIENNIYLVAKKIKQYYTERFIIKKTTEIHLSQEEFNIVRICHDWHKDNRDSNIVSLDKIMNIINSQKPCYINRMLKKNIVVTKDKSSKTEEDRNSESNVVKNSSVGDNKKFQKKKFYEKKTSGVPEKTTSLLHKDRMKNLS